MAGASRSMATIPFNSTFFTNGGNFGLFANDSVVKRSSWNIFRLYGFRRDEYRNAKK